RPAVRVRQPAVRVLADLALDQQLEAERAARPLAEEVDRAERAVGVLDQVAGEHRELAAVDVEDLAVDRPQAIGPPLVAQPGVDRALEAELRVAEPAVEA